MNSPQYSDHTDDYDSEYSSTSGSMSPYGVSSPQELQSIPLALGKQVPPQEQSVELEQATPEIHQLFAKQVGPQLTPVQAAGPESFCNMIERKGHEWEQHISATALHKVQHALGQRSEPDADMSQLMRDNMHNLFWILWTRSALFMLRCECGQELTAGIPGETFDAGHIDLPKHLDMAMARQLEKHPEMNAGSDMILLAQDVHPDDVNKALSSAWAFLQGGIQPELFGAESVALMQVIIGFMTEALSVHVECTEQHGVNQSPVGRELDRGFANFLAMCTCRAAQLMASACISAIEEHEEPNSPLTIESSRGPENDSDSESDLDW
jgi:hypothetical protein